MAGEPIMKACMDHDALLSAWAALRAVMGGIACSTVIYGFLYFALLPFIERYRLQPKRHEEVTSPWQSWLRRVPRFILNTLLVFVMVFFALPMFITSRWVVSTVDNLVSLYKIAMS